MLSKPNPKEPSHHDEFETPNDEDVSICSGKENRPPPLVKRAKRLPFRPAVVQRHEDRHRHWKPTEIWDSYEYGDPAYALRGIKAPSRRVPVAPPARPTPPVEERPTKLVTSLRQQCGEFNSRVNAYGVTEGKAVPWLKKFESFYLLPHGPGAQMDDVELALAYQVFYNLMDSGAQTFLDSYGPF